MENDGDSRMAECVDCGGVVSRKALLCPHCGRPFGSGPRYDVTVRDVEIRFGSMVSLMVGMAVAAIPAVIILTVIGAAVFAIGGAVLHR